ncbi:MAG: DUF3108 domain-containing protein [Verrucomicrobiota bacterium]
MRMRRLVMGTTAWLLLAVTLPLVAAVPDPRQGVEPARTPWQSGERLYYEIDFAFLTAAKGVFRATREKGSDHLELELRTSGIADAVFPIKSNFWSRMTRQPWRSIVYGEKRDENGDLNHERNTIDYAKGRGTRERYSDQQTDTFDFDPKLCLSDLVSMNYGLRYGPWKPGDKRRFDLHEGGSLKEGEATCVAVEEKSVADWPKQRVIQLRVVPLGDDREKGELELFLTDDGWRLPLLAKLKFDYGSAHIRLVKAETPGKNTREVSAD